MLIIFSSFLVACSGAVLFVKDPLAKTTLCCAVVMSFVGYVISDQVIPVFGEVLAKAGRRGKDLNKPEKLAKYVPESLGVVVGTVFLTVVILFQVTQFFQLNHLHSLGEYNAAMTSICFMIFLGFVDDVVELKWRYKFVLPTIASLPLIVAYNGPTSILVPKPFLAYLPSSIELGFFFQVYMCLLSVFCTNSINIYAGINGLEAGQSLVIACAVLTHSLIQLVVVEQESSQHVFSVSLMLPFAAVTLALLKHNWYPSKVFVGDCYTYFAGVTFAVVGILSHFPKTLLLFFLPQILNFLVSLPQLLKIIPCPKHRLPTYDERLDKLVPTPNYNIVNLALRFLGPMTEESLCKTLLVFQIVCCVGALCARYGAESVL